MTVPPYYLYAHAHGYVVAVAHPLGMKALVEAAAGRESVQAELFSSEVGWRFLEVFIFDTSAEAASATGRLRALEGVTCGEGGAAGVGGRGDTEREPMPDLIEEVDVQELFKLVAGLDADKKRELASLLKKQAKRQEEARRTAIEAGVIEAEQDLSRAEFEQRFAFDAAQELTIKPLREKLRKLGVPDRTQSRATRIWRKHEKELRKTLIVRGIVPGEHLEAELERERLLWFTSEDTLKRFPMEGYTARLSTDEPETATLVGGRWHIDYATGAWKFVEGEIGMQESVESDRALQGVSFAPPPARVAVGQSEL